MKERWKLSWRNDGSLVKFRLASKNDTTEADKLLRVQCGRFSLNRLGFLYTRERFPFAESELDIIATRLHTDVLVIPNDRTK